MKVFFENQKKKTPIVVFSSLRLCALSKNNLDYSAVFALVFAIDSYPTLTNVIRWHKQISSDLIADWFFAFFQKLPKEKRWLQYFAFSYKVSNVIKMLPWQMASIMWFVHMFQPCSPPVLVHLFNCLFSNLCPLCCHKTGCEHYNIFSLLLKKTVLQAQFSFKSLRF